MFEASVIDDQDHSCGTILDFVQRAPESVQWTVDKDEFDIIISTEKKFAPVPDLLLHSVYRCAGGGGRACPSVLFAASRTVSVPETSTVEEQGRIVRSPDA